jgi:voltage-gated potassium channel Kch
MGSPFFLFMMLMATFSGIFVISTLIGVITSGIEGKVEELRKGRSKVLVKDHTVVLGWNSQIFSVISELSLANESRKNPHIVVLATDDKVDMEDAIADRVDTKNTKVICRTGSPIDVDDLEIVSIQTARSIIVLAPEGDEPDSEVIKILLAILHGPNRRSEPYHVVAQIREDKNFEVAKLVARDEAELIQVDELIARITAQTCRQSGLSVVYTELLDFGGDEIYFQEEPALVGKTYGDALLSYEDCAIMGIHKADGTPVVNPPSDTPIGPGDRVIAIAEDDDKVRISSVADRGINRQYLRTAAPLPQQAEHTLILGWDSSAHIVIRELDAYVAKGSIVTVVAQMTQDEFAVAASGLKLANEEMRFMSADPTDRAVLNSLNVQAYHHVILVSPDDGDVQKADARTLVTLLHLRDIREKTGGTFSIVSEMQDMRNRRLAEVTQADDFIVGSSLISLMLTQVAENKHLNKVFDVLFAPDGSEIYLKPAIHYVVPGVPMTYYNVVEAARLRGETAIGYRIKADAKDVSKSYGVRTNPKKSEPVTFSDGDLIIVLAEN